MRPLLIPSDPADPVQKVIWRDRHTARLEGGHAVAEEQDGVIHLAIGLRNVGAGIALLHGWHPIPDRALVNDPPARPDDFRRLTIDLYVPAGGVRYWEGAVRDPEDAVHPEFTTALKEHRAFTIDLLYGDEQGGQRTISRFTVLPASGDGWYSQGNRHWNLDMPDPR